MPFKFTHFGDGYLPAATGALYTHDGNGQAAIKAINLLNTGNAATEVKLYRVAANAGAVGTANNGNKIVDVTLQAGQSYPWFGHAVLENQNDTIQGFATNASAVTYLMDGGTKT